MYVNNSFPPFKKRFWALSLWPKWLLKVYNILISCHFIDTSLIINLFIRKFNSFCLQQKNLPVFGIVKKTILNALSSFATHLTFHLTLCCYCFNHTETPQGRSSHWKTLSDIFIVSFWIRFIEMWSKSCQQKVIHGSRKNALKQCFGEIQFEEDTI